MLVSVLAVVAGFTVVPLRKGKEMQDAAARLAGGLLCSFMLGPMIAFKAVEEWPWMLKPWSMMLAGQHELWAYLGAATPFIAMTGLFGFWIVAAGLRWFEKRRGKDAGELISELRGNRGKD